jgi:hypothetical protein
MLGCCWLKDAAIRQFVLQENNFGWMDVWKLNAERLGSYWLKAFATGGGGGGSIWLKAPMTGGSGCAPFNYPLTFALQLRKARKTSARVAE